MTFNLLNSANYNVRVVQSSWMFNDNTSKKNFFFKGKQNKTTGAKLHEIRTISISNNHNHYNYLFSTKSINGIILFDTSAIKMIRAVVSNTIL